MTAALYHFVIISAKSQSEFDPCLNACVNRAVNQSEFNAFRGFVIIAGKIKTNKIQKTYTQNDQGEEDLRKINEYKKSVRTFQF